MKKTILVLSLISFKIIFGGDHPNDDRFRKVIVAIDYCSKYSEKCKNCEPKFWHEFTDADYYNHPTCNRNLKAEFSLPDSKHYKPELVKEVYKMFKPFLFDGLRTKHKILFRPSAAGFVMRIIRYLK